MNNPPYILVDEFKTIVEAVKTLLGLPVLNYDYGYIETLNARLMAMSQNQQTMSLKFPLVWVKQPFDIIRSQFGYYGKTRGLDIFIITGSQVKYSEQERMTLIFKPIINKIYYELIHQIKLSRVFTSEDILPRHVETDFYYWGENRKSVLNDIIDTKRIQGLELLVNNNPNCVAPSFT